MLQKRVCEMDVTVIHPLADPIAGGRAHLLELGLAAKQAGELKNAQYGQYGCTRMRTTCTHVCHYIITRT